MITIEMHEHAGLHVVGAAVDNLLEEGCYFHDILIKRENGDSMIAVLDPSAFRLVPKMGILFGEKFAYVKKWDLEGSSFLETNGVGFEEAWSVLGYPKTGV